MLIALSCLSQNQKSPPKYLLQNNWTGDIEQTAQSYLPKVMANHPTNVRVT